jgi:hypothetical protein
VPRNAAPSAIQTSLSGPGERASSSVSDARGASVWLGLDRRMVRLQHCSRPLTRSRLDRLSAQPDTNVSGNSYPPWQHLPADAGGTRSRCKRRSRLHARRHSTQHPGHRAGMKCARGKQRAFTLRDK